MPKFTYDFTNNQIDHFCTQEAYRDTIPNPAYISTAPSDPTATPPLNPPTIPNPENKRQFVARRGKEYFDGIMALGKKKTKEATRIAEDQTDATSVALPPPVIG